MSLVAPLVLFVLGSVGPEAPPHAGSVDLEADLPNWRFHRHDRPVKVVVLAGSIGAFARNPYHQELERVCTQIEVVNLSKTGLGAWALKQRLKTHVLEHPPAQAVARAAAGTPERWVLFAAGLNSVGTPVRTSQHLRGAYTLAHRAGWKVVALGPTPWGSNEVSRFRGLDGYRLVRATQHVTDFVVGRPTAKGDLEAPAVSTAPTTAPAEARPEVAVDLYDSPLRDADAPPRDAAALREALLADRTWQKAHEKATPEARQRALDEAALLAARVPQFFLKPELRAFDHAHPNREGHKLIAKVICPKLPTSWNCSCASL